MIYTIVKPLDKTTTEVYIEIIEYLSKVGIRTVIGDASVTTKKFLKRCKELGITYIGRIKKNWKTELFGDTEKIEKLFEKDLENNKFKLRTINGIKFKLSEKMVNIPLVGRVKIVAVFMENQKDAKKKSGNIIKEYMKRPKIGEVHRRYKSVLEIEGNYLTSKKIISDSLDL
ncbi:hypothetical protein ACO3VM_01395 [Methanocaldococcus sp. 10A]